MREDIADVEVAGEDDLGAGEVLERAADDEVRSREDDERGVVETDRLHQTDGDAGFRLFDRESIDDSDAVLDRLLAERRAQREAAHLLGHALRVAPRVGAEDDPAAFHGRLSRAAVSRTAGALLAVGLGAAAGDGGPRLRRGGTPASIRDLADESLVHDRRVDLLREDQFRQPDLA